MKNILCASPQTAIAAILMMRNGAKWLVWEFEKNLKLAFKEAEKESELPATWRFCPPAPIKFEIAIRACSDFCNMLTSEPCHMAQPQSAEAT